MGDPQKALADVGVKGPVPLLLCPLSPVDAGQGRSRPTGFGAAVGIGVGTLGVTPTLGHAMALLHPMAPGCHSVPGTRGAGSAGTGPRGRARRGCGGDAGSPSCRPGVSNEWYEFPARPLIASSKSLNELLLLRPAPRVRLMAWLAPPRCRMVLDAPRWAPTIMLEIHKGHPSPTAAPPSPGC